MINELVKMSVIKVWASLLTICTLEYFFPFLSSYASPLNDSSLLSKTELLMGVEKIFLEPETSMLSSHF